MVEVKQVRLTPRIRRPEVVRIALCWGSVAPLGGIQAALGIFAMLSSLYLVVGNVRDLMQHADKAHVWLLVGHAAFGVTGALMVLNVQKLGYYLEVRTNKRVEKLCFDRKISRAEVDAFLASVQSELGWSIDSASIEKVARI